MNMVNTAFTNSFRNVAKSSRFLAFMIYALLPFSAMAQMQIEITGVGQTLFPIAITRFLDESKLPTKVTDVIRADLARNGNFKNVETGNNEMAENSNPDYKSWAARQAQALAVGTVTVSGNQYEVKYKLFDIAIRCDFDSKDDLRIVRKR